MSFPWNIEKIDCENHFMKNFTTYLETWTKINNVGRIVNKEWRKHYCAIVHKLIKEKSEKEEDKEYFRKHIKLTYYHMTGSHNECDSFYCTSDYKT